MGKDKNKEPGSKFHDHDPRFRWGILLTVAVLFSIILFPNLVTTRHQYNLGDVAERDIKSPRDFFIEDQAATEINRRQSVDNVLTVYDYDSDLVRVLTHNVAAAFAEMRAISDVQDTPETQQPDSNGSSGEMTDAADNPSKPVIADKRKYLEEKLAIRVTEGAYNALEKAEFSIEISDLINRILQEILSNGVVTNKEILLKESEKGIILRNLSTKKEQKLNQLKKLYGLDQAKTMVRIVGQPLLSDLDYGLLNLVVDFVQRLIQPNITLNRSETQERINKSAAEIKPVLHKIKAGEMLLREGELVTEVQLLKLQTLETQTKKEQVF
jgi:membrane-associated HD superfamily phosphohydrolase